MDKHCWDLMVAVCVCVYVLYRPEDVSDIREEGEAHTVELSSVCSGKE